MANGTSTVPQSYEALSYAGPNLSQHRAAARELIDLTAAATLTTRQSGALVLMDAAVGFTITLPTPVVGMFFDFWQATTQTSGTQKIITSAATIFILGNAALVSNSAATAEAFSFDGSTHIALTMNGTTTGGIAGTKIRLTAISATLWAIESVIIGSGTLATPASTT